MADQGSNKKVANGLVALSSVAILAVYSAGFARTREAASRFSRQDAERRAHAPIRHEGRAPAAPSTTPAPLAVDQQDSRTDRALAARATSPRIADVAAPVAQADPKDSPRAAEPAATPHAAEPAPSAAAPPISEVPSTEVASVTPPVPAAPPTPAPSPTVAPTPTVADATPKFRDGTFFGWGTSRHGDIQAAVVVEGGRITTARVAQCLTRYSCSWIEPIPPVILKQQAPTYDYVSGATESSDAFQTAVADALSHAVFHAQ